MDPKELRFLRLLEVIEKNPTPSQRELAACLDVSLGLVNANIRASAENGFVSIRQMGKNRFHYSLTPKGAAEKRRLTHLFLQYGYRFYTDARAKIKSIFDALEQDHVITLVFFGAGDLAALACQVLKDTCLQIVAVIDDQRIGERVDGVIVRETASLKDLAFDRLVVTCDGFREKLRSGGISDGIPSAKIVHLA